MDTPRRPPLPTQSDISLDETKSALVGSRVGRPSDDRISGTEGTGDRDYLLGLSSGSGTGDLTWRERWKRIGGQE